MTDNNAWAEYEALMNQGSSQGSTTNKPKISKEEFAKRYFNEKLAPGEMEGKKTIRILPPLVAGQSPFSKVFFHELYVEKDKKLVYCPNRNDGQPCPSCEKEKILLATGDEAKRKEAFSHYKAYPYYIARVVEREKDQDGVKFWRFKESRKKDGIYDKMAPVLAHLAKKNVIAWDLQNGCDLILNIQRNDQNHNILNAVLYDLPGPITDDAALYEKIITDKTTYKEVWAVRPYEYIEIILNGGIPFFSRNLNKYVPKSEFNRQQAETDKPAAPANPQPRQPQQQQRPTAPPHSTPPPVEDVDLPF